MRGTKAKKQLFLSPFKGQLFFLSSLFSIPADRSIERGREMNEALSSSPSSSSSLKGTPQPKAWKKGLPAEEEEENLGKRTKGRRKKKKKKKRKKKASSTFPLWSIALDVRRAREEIKGKEGH